MNIATTSESEQGQLRGINTSTSSNNSSSSTRISNNNWVRNFSKTPLTDAQQCLLSHGPDFVIVPREPPACKYIVATEKVCQQLTQGKAEELRSEIKSLLRKDHKTKPNIPRDEHQMLREIKKDNTRMVLTADKGVSLVVLDSDNYTAKSEELLHQPNYKILKADPTNKYKNKLIVLLKPSRQKVGLMIAHTEGCIPQGLYHQSIMGYLRCINLGCH